MTAPRGRPARPPLNTAEPEHVPIDSGPEVLQAIKWGPDGLVPAIVQDAATGRVLTFAWLNRESLERTIVEGETWLWSRSRQELWHKGATSGNTQTVKAIRLDCDGDAVTILVDPAGPACHTGNETCFHHALSGDAPEPFAAIADLTRVIAERAQAADPDGSRFTGPNREGDPDPEPNTDWNWFQLEGDPDPEPNSQG